MATYILIPGAGGDGWYWHRLVPELEARGHAVVPVTLPASDESAGWAEYADAIVAAIHDGRDLILVAQSLAGFSAPIACDRLAVDLLILLNAMIPLPGETGNAWWTDTRQQEAQQAYFASIGLDAKLANDESTIYFHDASSEIVAEAFQRGEAQQSMTPMTQPWPMRAWPDVETRILAGRDDRLFPAEFQRRVARERLGLEAELIAGGHLAALSRPHELAERLHELGGRLLAPSGRRPVRRSKEGTHAEADRQRIPDTRRRDAGTRRPE
jgi:pimeloyl-ACP methyl ester carboxylesterase